MRSSKSTAAVLVFTLAALGAATGQPQPDLPIHKQKYVMGTVFEIVAYETSADHANRAIDRAFEEIVRLDSVMSNYKRDSELSRLNRTAHFHPQAVSLDLYRVIEESLQYSRVSGGKFDISVGPLVDLWKAQLRGERLVSAQDEMKARQCVGYEKIRLLPPDHVEFQSRCLRIDLGAIGKGYALDRAVEVLRSQGIERALISAGGSTIYALGTPPGRNGWSVQLRDPTQRVAPEVLLKDDSVSTSEQSTPSSLDAKPAGHVIDPQQGTPMKTSYAVSVVAPSATASDALSTTLLLLGPQAGKSLIKQIARTAAVWVGPGGEVESALNGAEIGCGGSRVC